MSGRWPKDCFTAFDRILQCCAPLAPRTTWRIGGAAEFLLVPEDVHTLKDVLGTASQNAMPVRVLGSGGNLLISDGLIQGAVVHLGRLKQVRWDGERVIAQAGASLHRLARQAIQKGLGGLEVTSGIPASLGGAAAMNAGGKYGAFGDLVTAATVIDRTGCLKRLERQEMVFEYRKSSLAGQVIVEVELTLALDERQRLEATYRKILEEKSLAQPLHARTAGCVFKNPPNLSAGLLIQEAGLKGTCVGDACVSEKHGNFIINKGKARAKDVLELVDLIRENVKASSGADLEMEVKVWQEEGIISQE